MNITKLCIALCVVCTCGYFAYHKITTSSPFMYVGTLETKKVTISAEEPGRIVTFAITEGQDIKNGDEIAHIDDSMLRIYAKRWDSEYKRYKKLFGSGNVSQERFEEVVKNAEETNLRIQRCKIVSPINGTVVSKLAECGEYVTTGRCIAVIADQDDIWAYFYVSYDVIASLKIGQKVDGWMQEMPDKKFAGKIVKINAQAEFTPKNVQTREERTRLVCGVKVRFENVEHILKDGMTIECSLKETESE